MRYRLEDIVQYVEKGMDVDKAAHFEHVLSMDPTLREATERYYKKRIILKMVFSSRDAYETLEKTLTDMNTKYFTSKTNGRRSWLRFLGRRCY